MRLSLRKIKELVRLDEGYNLEFKAYVPTNVPTKNTLLEKLLKGLGNERN